MRAISALYVVLIGFALIGGCDTVNGTSSPNEAVVEAAKTVFASKVVYASALESAARYAKLPTCKSGKPVVDCKTKDVLLILRKAEIAADAANQTAEDAAKSMSENKAVVKAASEAATKTTRAFKLMIDQYFKEK